MRRLKSGLAVAAIAMGFVAASSSRADAGTLTLFICDTQFCTANSVVAVDNVSNDLNPGTGRIATFEGGIGGFDVFDMESALAQPADGIGVNPLLDITYQASAAPGTTGDVWLYLTDTDFTGMGGLTIQNNGNNNGGTVTTADVNVYGGTSNSPVDIGNLIGSVSGLTASGFFPFNPSVNPYSLTLEFHLVASGTTTGDVSTSVPEPASMALFGFGMLGAALRRRYRRA